MSEYTFETAALKAVTIDAVKYNEEGLKNSLTPEAIQQVVPIKWYGSTAPTLTGYGISLGSGVTATDAVCIGGSASAAKNGVAVGVRAYTTGDNAVALGEWSNAAQSSVALGSNALANYYGAVSVGYMTRVQKFAITAGNFAQSNKSTAITIGAQFTETTDSGNVTHTCSTQGTGSITIGAGANTLNNGDTESSNSVTIGCKALNQGADSVVIGAQAEGIRDYSIVIGAGAKAKSNKTTIVGYKAASSHNAIAIGLQAIGNSLHSIAIGGNSKTGGEYSVAIGTDAKVSDYGAAVIRSTAEDRTYTQLYFSGANTPLAKKYFPTAWEQKQDVDPETGDPLFDDDGNPVMVDDPEKPIAGEAMMGFVAKDSAGNIIARGANMLSALFPYYTGEDDDPFQPTGMSLRGGEKPEPIAFHPSDLDIVEEEMEVEEPGATEPNKPFVYKPLPVYPIVEPEIEDINE